ncbi:septal ring lytic transglycosylase RlpA family protein [Candidatus Accumulibacter sp. ACC003]|uniref:septal ring lytic transglycosylase RlpA family protein n=1 Tax=Candidatus Accumulibacter sp. ACC003 TaxID=2823334 RepID=UPI0025BBFFEC|nr:septal ring lytic transglycosylase RlpA family protein [Candidatus Accumulibacter sp. ACC003]
MTRTNSGFGVRVGRSVLCLSALAVLLAGCGGQPSRSTTGEQASGKMARKSGVVQKRGGGYYKDDGPGDQIPDNLDEIPDAQPQLEPLHRFANRPYVVLGKSYQPNTDLAPYRQQGVASWYGKKFHGQKTSIGERYDMFSMTAAHPTLAIPSYARVTNLRNGKSVVVRVIDRGPFHADRIIDLSYVAAYRLGYVDDGSAQVQVESILPDEVTAMSYAQVMPAARPGNALPAGGRDQIEVLAANLGLELASVGSVPSVASSALPESSPPPTPPTALSPAVVSTATAAAASPPAHGVFLQLGAFASADNAESLRLHLTRELDWLSEGVVINAGGGMHRVHMGPYRNRADAEAIAEKIRLALGYKPTFVSR